jgi:hypothetical protein
MKSQTTLSFWKHYWALPPEIRQRARQAYKLWRDNPTHPSLFFKQVKKKPAGLLSAHWFGIQSAGIAERRYGNVVLDWYA